MSIAKALADLSYEQDRLCEQRRMERERAVRELDAPSPPPALSPERRAEIEARLAAATPGEWKPSARHGLGPETDEVSGLGWDVEGPPEPVLRGQFSVAADAALIAHAPTDLRALLDEVARLTGEVEMGRRRERSAGEAHGRVLAALRAENERLEREVARLQDVTEALSGPASAARGGE